ncbi:MAG: tRNA (guanosine(37)-N1)-methyltransferase TrmD [Phycisphaerae bacterium]|nr:tRNA (guanosine(37)-N1)-methyltransferase TrmD [Phycisphaerae bacterium]
MRFDLLSLFPEVLTPYLGASILGRASAAGIAEFHTHQLRDFSQDPHKKVDDRPFGGGPGMVLMCQPVIDAVAAIEAMDPRPALRVLLTPQGRRFDQSFARELSAAPRMLLICGHYEGYDERIVELLQPVEISLGDFVLTGGELAALTVVDAVARLLPGVLGNEQSASDESFSHGNIEYPHYTRPRDYRGLSVPEVLLNGNHAEIARWRAAQSADRTAARRPDLGGSASHSSARLSEISDGASVERTFGPKRHATRPSARAAAQLLSLER